MVISSFQRRSEQRANAQPFGLGSVSVSVRIKSKSTEELTPGVGESRQDTHPVARRGTFALKRLWLQGVSRRKAEQYGQSMGFASTEITGKTPSELRHGLNSDTEDAKLAGKGGIPPLLIAKNNPRSNKEQQMFPRSAPKTKRGNF